MSWRIEQAKSDRSTCRLCGQKIAKGEHRFGQDDLNATWYHLACAPAGKPRAFKPFADKAAKLAAATPAKAKPAAKPKAKAGNPELEAKLVANPDDADTRAVYADWLQAQGDPWGELIALVTAEKTKDAKKLLKANADSLIGGFGERLFDWRGGFIEVIRLDKVKPAQAKPMLEKMLALRTTLLARELVLPMKLDAELARTLSKVARSTVRDVFGWLDNGIAELAMPHLEALRLFHTRDAVVDAAALAPFFDGARLPKLREVEVIDRPLPLPVLEAFLDSKLLQQLECVALNQNAIDDAGVELVLNKKTLLARVPRLQLGATSPQLQARLDRAFKTQIAACKAALHAKEEAQLPIDW